LWNKITDQIRISRRLLDREPTPGLAHHWAARVDAEDELLAHDVACGPLV